MSNRLQPTLQSNRDYFLDVWRGFAITGVLFAYIIWNLGNLPEQNWTAADKAIAWFTGVMIDGKFYTALCMLFGIGFYLQFEKSRQSQRSIIPFALRRVFLLMLIGAVHALSLRRGDVLMPYALCSLYLLLARNAGNKTLVVLMIFCFLFPTLYWQFLKWAGYKSPPWQKDTGVYMKDMLQAFSVRHHPLVFFVNGLNDCLLFLLGFYAAKNNWLHRLSNQPKRLFIVFVSGLLLGVGMYFLDESSHNWFGPFPKMNYAKRIFAQYTWLTTYLLHCISLAVAYMSGLYWLYLRNHKMKPFADLGRMALTNYLSQSLIMIPACFIFGLFDHFTPLKTLAWFTCLWIAQVLFCTWWLKRYNFGPFEWLLRSFTYWKWQPMKKIKTIQTSEMAL